MRRTVINFLSGQSFTKSALLPLDALIQMQLGITPPLSVQRGFLLEHCAAQLQERGITETKLIAMDGRLCTQLLKQLVYERYLSVPFRVYSFDMEFTGPPVFTSDGPTEDITELGLYSPERDAFFSCLVRPACGRTQGPGVAELTHITNDMLEKQGIPFVDAWNQFLDFIKTPEPGEKPGAEHRILLLSHGGKLADVSLIKWTLEKFHLSLPSNLVFGDTVHLIRDAHRRRPVTVDKHPPSWKLVDLVQWLKLPLTLPAHRAGNDAKMTWDALYHTLLRYGDHELTPREQLVSHFFDDEAKSRMKFMARLPQRSTIDSEVEEEQFMTDTDFTATHQRQHYDGALHGVHRATSTEVESSNDILDLDFDAIFKSSALLKHNSDTRECAFNQGDNALKEGSAAETADHHILRKADDNVDTINTLFVPKPAALSVNNVQTQNDVIPPDEKSIRKHKRGKAAKPAETAFDTSSPISTYFSI